MEPQLHLARSAQALKSLRRFSVVSYDRGGVYVGHRVMVVAMGGKVGKQEKGLATPVQYVQGVGPQRAMSFSRLGVRTAADLLHYFPRWHLHRDIVGAFRRPADQSQWLLAVVLGSEEKRNAGRHVLKVLLQDALHPGVIASWYWFNAPYLGRTMRPGQAVSIRGVVEETSWGLRITGEPGSFEWVPMSDVTSVASGQWVSVYHATPVLTQDTLRDILGLALPMYAGELEDPIPVWIRDDTRLMGLTDAVRALHQPLSREGLTDAKNRMAFDELLALQMYLLQRRAALQRVRKGRAYHAAGTLYETFRAHLPFTLTGAQQRVIGEITTDLQRDAPMNRLLQGDVGSGKTVVAAHAMVVAVASGYQAAVMAPTEMLAEQHARTLTSWLAPLSSHVTLGVLTGSIRGRARTGLLERVAAGTVQIVVGTHALLEEQIKFQRLGLVVIDERHKFGVQHRMRLQHKGHQGGEPDCLMMTATPFPRSLVLTLYGDTDLSVLDELPPGRQPIVTRWMQESQRQELYRLIREHVKAGGQVYMVYPAIEEGSAAELKAATQMAEELQTNAFKEFRLGLVHGRLPGPERERLLKAFRDHEVDILIATTVIEVGVDIPRATVMVIEHANRFGLAQLHQLRGRVGRGAAQSHCYLMTEWKVSGDAKVRLSTMERTTNGFEIAEADLRLRGPGDLLGMAQHGAKRHKGAVWVDVLSDTEILHQARRVAQLVMEQDPSLESDMYRALRADMIRRYHADLELLRAS